MPSYKAIAEGFINGTTYSPEGKRTIVVTDKPLNPIPSWLVLIDEKLESKKAREAREAAEIKAAEKAAADTKKAGTDADFLGSNKVEVL